MNHDAPVCDVSVDAAVTDAAAADGGMIESPAAQPRSMDDDTPECFQPKTIKNPNESGTDEDSAFLSNKPRVGKSKKITFIIDQHAANQPSTSGSPGSSSFKPSKDDKVAVPQKETGAVVSSTVMTSGAEPPPLESTINSDNKSIATTSVDHKDTVDEPDSSSSSGNIGVDQVVDQQPESTSTTTVDSSNNIEHHHQQQEGMVWNDELSQWRFKDPATGQLMKWSEDTGIWVGLEEDPTGTNASGEQQAGPGNDENMSFVDGEWVYTNPDTGQAMTFDVTSQDWVAKLPGTEATNGNGTEGPPEDSSTAGPVKGPLTGGGSSTSESELESEPEEDGDDLAYQLRQEKAERHRARRQAEMGGIRVDDDGTEFEWDAGKRAWVPMLSEDFMAQYQAHYGCFQEDEKTEGTEVKEIGNNSMDVGPSDPPGPSSNQERPELPPLPDDPREAKKEKRRRAREAEKNRTWFAIEDDRNTNVYVSNLPLDITETEFEELMVKYGIVDKDPASKALKLKLYKDGDGKPKGDGRCCYIKVESVQLCLQLLDGYELRGRTIAVQRAQFEQKGEFDPKRRKRLTGKQKADARAKKEKLFDWRPDKIKGERPKSDCVIVLKNVFQPNEILANAALMFDLQDLLQKQCQKLGEIRKIMIYENNPDGVATIGFSDPAMADDCLTMMNYRMMRGRQISAERWDGKTKYKIEETEAERQQRIDQWNR